MYTFISSFIDYLKNVFPTKLHWNNWNISSPINNNTRSRKQKLKSVSGNWKYLGKKHLWIVIFRLEELLQQIDAYLELLLMKGNNGVLREPSGCWHNAVFGRGPAVTAVDDKSFDWNPKNPGFTSTLIVRIRWLPLWMRIRIYLNSCGA